MVRINHLSLYKDNSEIFQKYISLTDQKQVLINKVYDKIINKFTLKKLSLLDIGCADGFVTLNIIDKIKSLYQLDITAIDASTKLINKFKANTNYNISFINEEVEALQSLPQSDFILMAHVISYINNLDKFLDKVIDSLNENAIALIVVSNEFSDDKKVKNATSSKTNNDTTTESIKNILSKKNIRYSVEVVETKIDVSGIKDMKEKGKTIIEFFKHERFENIPSEEIKDMRNAILGIAKDNKLIKRENYIWIEK